MKGIIKQYNKSGEFVGFRVMPERIFDVFGTPIQKQATEKGEIEEGAVLFLLPEPTKEELREKEIKELADSIEGLEETIIELSEAVEKKAEKGDPGDSPTKEELTKLIKPLIPKPISSTYALTPADKKEIASKIQVPVVERIIEKTEVIREQPIVTNEIKEVFSNKEINEIWDKLKSLELAISSIPHQTIQAKRKFGSRGGGGFTTLTRTGAVNGVNVTFTFTQKPTFIISDGAWYRENSGWTWSGLTATMTIPPNDDLYGFVQ